MRRYVFILLSVAFMIGSMWPTIYELQRRSEIRENRTFELVHNYYTDFNFYLSRIRQGLEGNLTVHEKYTSEPHQGSFIHIFYLMLGWIGKQVNVPWHRTADIYHASRIVLSLTLLLLFAEAVKHAFLTKSNGDIKKDEGFWWAVLAFIFAVTASTYHIIVHMEDGSLRIGGYMPWWSVMDSLQRITFIPHLLFGQAMIVFLFITLTNWETMKRTGNWIFLGVIGFICGIIFPPGLVFIDAAVPIMVLIEYFFANPRPTGAKIIPWLIHHAIGRIAFIVISSPSLLYLQLMTSFYPWKQLALADIQHPLPYKFWEYMRAVGDMLPLGILGLFIAVRRKERKMILPIVWVVTWALCLWLFTYIPSQSPLRFSEMIVHLPLGILAAYFFYELYRGISAFIQRKIVSRSSGSVNHGIWKNRKFVFVIRNAIFVIPFSLIVANFLHMYSSWYWQRDFVIHKMVAAYPLVPTGSYVMYPLKDFIDAIRFIQDHSGRAEVILSQTTAGNYIPVYSGNTVYVGHENTVNRDEKEQFVRSFFSGAMPMEQAKKWLDEEHMHWIFFGPQEREDSAGAELTKFYPFLEVRYQGEYVTVYSVK